jgi:hypothetical protein
VVQHTVEVGGAVRRYYLHSWGQHDAREAAHHVIGRAANESSLSGLDLAQLSSYKNSSEFILSRVNVRAVKVGSYSACNDLESIFS